MKRLLAVSVAVLGAYGAAQGGQIVNIGYVNTNSGAGTLGNYGIVGYAPSTGSGGVIPPCGGYVPATATGCTAPSPNDAFDTVKGSYTSALFQAATLGTPPPTASSTTPDTVYANNNPGVTFALMGANAGGTQNFWINKDQTNNDYVYVPINQDEVDNVYTMLNDVVGSDVQLTFYFNSTDSTSGATQVVLNLTDGLNIRSALLCTSGCPAGASTTLTAGAAGTQVAASNLPIGSTINVSTGSICTTPGANCTPWTSTYSNITGNNPDAGSSGNLTLDYQDFQFGSLFTNDWLVGVKVTELATTGPNTSANQFALSAISVDQVPEPGTITLGLTGLILVVGVGLIRRKRIA